jgi:hypothetical protein
MPKFETSMIAPPIPNSCGTYLDGSHKIAKPNAVIGMVPKSQKYEPFLLVKISTPINENAKPFHPRVLTQKRGPEIA